VEKTVTTQPVLAAVYMVIFLFMKLVPSANAALFAWVGMSLVFLCIACKAIRCVWKDARAGDADFAEQSFKQEGIPLLSLFLLQVFLSVWFLLRFLLDTAQAFVSPFLNGGIVAESNAAALSLVIAICLALAALIFMPLTLWWTVKSSIAMPIIVLEDKGAVAAIKQSHQMINGRFWSVCRYLVPVYLLAIIPAEVIANLLLQGKQFMLLRPVSTPILIGADMVVFLLQAVLEFFSRLLLICCLTKLFLYLKDINAQASADV
jgi:hypothetical protein